MTLTTDFGLADHYVGTMKGVILGRCPHATLVDITHQIPRFSVLAGAYAVAQAAPYFPPGTVHLVVVDPGVGTRRHALAVRADRHFFIAPDNGVLGMALKGKAFEAFEITNEKVMTRDMSQTFHGRDIFAPAAAELAAGALRTEEMGPRSHELVQLESRDEREAGGAWHGSVLSIDQFGNVITNLAIERHRSIALERFSICLGDGSVGTFASAFGMASPDRPFAYFGSSGFVEIGINQASAAAALRVQPGSPVRMQMLAPPGEI